MKFGTILTPHWDGSTEQSFVLNEMIDRIVFAEKCGFWSSWTTEHHFSNDPDYLPFGWKDAQFRAYDLASDPLTLLTYAAAKTDRIRLGTGVLVLPYDDPIRVAERAALVDQFSGGRLEIGLGKGGGVREPAVFGVPSDPAKSQQKFMEGIDVLLKAWGRKPFTHSSEFFEIPEIEVVPFPLQKPHPRLFMGSANPDSIKYAASNGLSYATVTGAWGWHGVDDHNKAHELYLETSKENGRDVSDALYPNTLFLFCAETDSEAEEMAEKYMMRFSAHVEGHYERQRQGDAFINAVSSITGGVEDTAALNDVRALARKQAETNLIGSPDTICQKLTALLDRVPSVNYVLAITDAGSPPRKFVHRSMELFASQVMPHFADIKPLEAAS